ncbi:MAG TPA: T9SS type A sorting domain-containing protein, partial [Bacteroidia bacterium]|nr:T9SS type A sorting domain-containing protein [Bacteroidia bacterium]
CDSAFFPASGAFNRCTSVESELALIMGPHASGILSTVPSYNPYYDVAKHFDRDSTGIFLVSRLDGFSVFRAQQLVDHGGPDRQYVVADAEIVLDHFSIDTLQSSLLPFVSSYHHSVELQMSALGYAVLNDSNPGTFVQNHPHVLANLAAFEQDSLVTVVEPNLDFLPGSAAFLWTDQDPLFADDQSLYTAIDAITDGAAVVCSRVGIGYFGTGVQPIAFLTRYADTTTTDRFNAAEAYYLSVPHLSVQHVMYGDPKTSILPSVTLSAENPLALPPFALFPNPTHGNFTVRLQDAGQGDVSLQILDLQGKLMLQKLQQGGAFLEVDASGLAQGLYIVQVRQGERSASKKLSVLH